MNTPKSLNILCFGDSLTAGYSHVGAPDHPYGESLRASLTTMFPQTNVTVDIQGQGGDFVTSPPGQFLARIKSLYLKNSSRPYDFAVILGGTNDLNNDRKAADIWPALLDVWSIPLSNSTSVLSMTIPESGYAKPQVDHERDSLNALILGHKSNNFYTFDFHSAIPYWAMPEEKRNSIWSDPVHLTARGYDLLGNLLANRLADIIKIQKTL